MIEINYADVYVPKENGIGSEWQHFTVGKYFECVDADGAIFKTTVKEIYVNSDTQITIICEDVRLMYSGMPFKVFYEMDE